MKCLVKDYEEEVVVDELSSHRLMNEEDEKEEIEYDEQERRIL